MLELNIPSSANVVKVSIIDSTGHVRGLPSSHLFKPDINGFGKVSAGCFVFLVEHKPSGGKLLFDLGIRKDLDGHSPATRELFKLAEVTAEKDIREILEENGVGVDSISDIIWSHYHFDHTGDPSTFPPSTNLVVGPNFRNVVGDGYPYTEDSPVTASAWEGRQLVELDFEKDKRSTQVGRYKALDWFGDGSFYILQTPGHTDDHICGFGRTKLAAESSLGKDEFILMGGDVAHHGGEFKPNEHTHIPHEISPDPRRGPFAGGICPGELFAQRNKIHEGENRWSKPFLLPALTSNFDEAIWSLEGFGEFDALENVFIVFAHDGELEDVVDYYPKDATEWVEKGWKREGRWRFLKDFAQA